MKRESSGSLAEAVFIEAKTGLAVFLAPVVAVGRAIAGSLSGPQDAHMHDPFPTAQQVAEYEALPQTKVVQPPVEADRAAARVSVHQ